MNSTVISTSNIRPDHQQMSKLIMAVAAVWFISAFVLAFSGMLDFQRGGRPLGILLAIVVPVIIYLLAYFSLPVFREWVLSLDMRPLILLHSMRTVGLGFIFLHFNDLLPALFAYPAGLGDAMAAIGALLLGISLFVNPESVSRSRIFMWNSFGVLDFIIAVSLGVLTRSGDILHLSGHPSSDIMTNFPLALIPGFAVPFLLITHLMIYAQLNSKHSEEVIKFNGSQTVN